jgi:Asp-tRNA(Asn)/Glu-tRNA(Gln) amidotransferase A subunit family amidase
VLNPYDVTRTPGGSSGGTGASITANFAMAGIGSDTMNSVDHQGIKLIIDPESCFRL